MRSRTKMQVVGFGVSLFFVCPRLSYAQRPVFRVGTTLVNFTVVAVDARGNPVTDLKSNEISIFEDDSPRDLAFLQFEGAPGVSGVDAGTPSLPSGTVTNRVEYAPGAPRNLVAVVLDFANASLTQQFELRAQFLEYLKMIPADARIGLYVIRDSAVAIHDFTQDAGAVRARLERGELDVYARALARVRDMQKLLAGARPEQVGSLAALAQADARGVQDFNVQIARDRRKKALAALDSVGDHLAGLPGRKSVVWISHGFPLTSTLEASYVDEVRDTSRRLATRDVAVYPVDAGGVRVERGNPAARGRIEGTGELVASITGGRPLRNNNDLTFGLSAAAADARGAYSLGFYALNDPDNQWHRLRVRISRPGVTLRHREGYLPALVPVDAVPGKAQQDWNDLAFRPLISTGIRINARQAAESGFLRFDLEVATGDLQFRPDGRGLTADVDVALVEKTSDGPTNVRVQQASVRVSPGTEPAIVPIHAEFKLNPQTISIRIIVRDNVTGRFGSLDMPRVGYAAK